MEDQESDVSVKIKDKLEIVAAKQRITLFDEDEVADPSLITTDLIQDIATIGLDLVSDLITYNQELSEVEVKTVEKLVPQTVEFGITLPEVKDIQHQARQERKACHHIIVEIEKLMYEMSSLLNNTANSESNESNVNSVFSNILQTYLVLPHRLKPIFDQCKKLETIIIKALKAQDQIISV